LRILWSANAVWSTSGYGVQGRSILPRLHDAGHEVANFAWYGLQGGVIQAGDIRVYPIGNEPFGSDIIGAHVADFKADLVVSLMDIWVLPDDYAERCKPASWACWFPVDHEPCPPRVAELAKKCDYPITYCNFGQSMALQAGIANSRCIPLGVETNTFKPGDKAAARKAMNIPADAYLVSMVAANKSMPPRKAFPENLQAFARFRARHPEAILYLHTLSTTAQGGVNFERLVEACDIPMSAVRFVDQYLYTVGLPSSYLADVYRASDVLLAASQSEGFGIPIIEAQACGCPVITTNCTSMLELTINGIATEPTQRMWTPLDSWCAVPSVDAIEAALEDIHARTTNEREAWGAYGALHVRERYDWDMLVRDYWLPFLAEVEQNRAGTDRCAAKPVSVAAVGG
jgi:glycosyltransferase involved in cell wall biosynthesis